MAKIVYSPDTTEGWDLSDEGKQMKEVENEIDFFYLIKKLPPKEQKIARMIGDGYTWDEIQKKLHIRKAKIGEVLRKMGTENGDNRYN